MNKQEFLDALRARLFGLPTQEIEERLAFYSEIIDDKIEEGLSEEEAVEQIGSVEEIAEQSIAEGPLAKMVKEKIRKKRRMKAWEITLLIAGFPLWFSLLAVAFSVALALYVSIWSIVASLWAVFGALCGVALGGVAGGIVFLCVGKAVGGLACIGAGLVCAGLSIFAFFGCRAVTLGIVWLTRKAFLGVKNSMMKQEVEK